MGSNVKVKKERKISRLRPLARSIINPKDRSRTLRLISEQEASVGQSEAPQGIPLPEKRLLIAVFRTAICDYLYGSQHVARQARAWIFGTPCVAAQAQFTFDEICDFLKFDSRAARTAIKHLQSYESADNVNTSALGLFRLRTSLVKTKSRN